MVDNIYEGVIETIQISTEDIIRCEPCNYLPKNLSDAINHKISNHGYKLLHIGSSSSTDEAGNMISDIIALLGK